MAGSFARGCHGLCRRNRLYADTRSRWHVNNFQQTVSESALDVDAEAADFDLPEEVAHRVGELIASQLASIAVVIDPEAIVLGGGILDPRKSLWHCVNEAFGRLVIKDLSGMLPLLPPSSADLPRRSGRHIGVFMSFFRLRRMRDRASWRVSVTGFSSRR